MNKFRNKDPYYEREASRYKHPVPSREYILQYLTHYGKPANFKHLLKVFKINDDIRIDAFKRRLTAMIKQGQLMSNRQGSYALVDEMALVRGRVEGHRDGHGYVVAETEEEDIYLSPYQMRCVFPNDMVLVRKDQSSYRGQPQGIIVEVIERHTEKLVGRFHQESGVSFVTPENREISQDIIIAPEDLGQAKQGQIVTVAITAYPTHKRQATGKIVEIVGDHMAPGMEIDIAIRAYGIPHEWPEAIQSEISEIKTSIAKQEISRRKDLRNHLFFTIDGADAKDFDDAIYCEKTEKDSWRLWVAIADVSHYVKPNAALNEEALRRGNSVYFPNRVVPMLPEILSNELCSLNPEQDRLVLVCKMLIDKHGDVTNYQFHEAIIRSKYRLTYTQALQIIKQQVKKKLTPVKDQLCLLYTLYQKLKQRRHARGALDFETTDTKIIFDGFGKISEIVEEKRNDAHRIIEECMLLANVCCAKYLTQHDMPVLYRVHMGLDVRRLSDLITFLKGLGMRVGFSDKVKPTAKQVAKLLTRAKQRNDGHIIQTVILRTMRQAVYAPVNKGHFGLAYSQYTHFTSPIRRYPDLIVHRAVKHILQGGNKDNFIYHEGDMNAFGERCSTTERRADEAVRDAVAWLKCEYMQDKIGKTFNGIISNVTGFGIFVEISEIFVEGLVHITTLPNDYYHFDPIRYWLKGRHTGRKFKLGDAVRVKVVRVNLEDRQMDFGLV